MLLSCYVEFNRISLIVIRFSFVRHFPGLDSLSHDLDNRFIFLLESYFGYRFCLFACILFDRWLRTWVIGTVLFGVEQQKRSPYRSEVFNYFPTSGNHGLILRKCFKTNQELSVRNILMDAHTKLSISSLFPLVFWIHEISLCCILRV